MGPERATKTQDPGVRFVADKSGATKTGFPQQGGSRKAFILAVSLLKTTGAYAHAQRAPRGRSLESGTFATLEKVQTQSNVGLDVLLL